MEIIWIVNNHKFIIPPALSTWFLSLSLYERYELFKEIMDGQ